MPNILPFDYRPPCCSFSITHSLEPRNASVGCNLHIYLPATQGFFLHTFISLEIFFFIPGSWLFVSLFFFVSITRKEMKSFINSAMFIDYILLSWELPTLEISITYPSRAAYWGKLLIGLIWTFVVGIDPELFREVSIKSRPKRAFLHHHLHDWCFCSVRRAVCMIGCVVQSYAQSAWLVVWFIQTCSLHDWLCGSARRAVCMIGCMVHLDVQSAWLVVWFIQTCSLHDWLCGLVRRAVCMIGCMVHSDVQSSWLVVWFIQTCSLHDWLGGSVRHAVCMIGCMVHSDVQSAWSVVWFSQTCSLHDRLCGSVRRAVCMIDCMRQSDVPSA